MSRKLKLQIQIKLELNTFNSSQIQATLIFDLTNSNQTHIRGVHAHLNSYPSLV